MGGRGQGEERGGVKLSVFDIKRTAPEGRKGAGRGERGEGGWAELFVFDGKRREGS